MERRPVKKRQTRTPRTKRRDADAEPQKRSSRRSSIGTARIRCWPASSSATSIIADSLVLDPPPGAHGAHRFDGRPDRGDCPARRLSGRRARLRNLRPRQGRRASLSNTNWPRKLSFPTFCLNVLEYLAGGTEDSQLASTRPGRPVELRPAGNVAGADGRRSDRKRAHDSANRAKTFSSFTTPSELGVYDVRRGDQVIERFAVNLFDRQESDVRVRPTQDGDRSTIRPADIRIGNIDVAATVGQTPSRTEVWKIVLVVRPVRACPRMVYLQSPRVFVDVRRWEQAE